jgi:hypothetical protein
LHEVPSFISLSESYWYIDLKNNQISDIQPQHVEHFTVIDLRGNPVDCLNSVLRQIHIKSDCLFPDITVKQSPDSLAVTYPADFSTDVNTGVSHGYELNSKSDCTLSSTDVNPTIAESVGNTITNSSSHTEVSTQTSISLVTLWLMSTIIIVIVILSVVTGILTKRLIKIQGAVRNINLSEM